MGKPATILEAYDLGLSVFPVGKGTKKPLSEWKGYQTARPAREEVAKWQRQPKTSVSYGIAMGPVSGFVAVDTDSPEGEDWAQRNLPKTPWISKTRKGMHRLYRWPAELKASAELYRNRTGIWLDDGTHLRIDVRGDGGYIVGPGSEHPDGGRYEAIGSWSTADLEAVPEYDPAWFGRGMGLEPSERPAKPSPRPPQTKERRSQRKRLSLFGRAELWLDKRDPAIQGQWGDRHTYVTAGRLRDKFGLDRPDITALMLRWNQTCLPPWTDRGLESKIDSAMKAPPGAFLKSGESPEDEWAYSDEWRAPANDEPHDLGRSPAELEQDEPWETPLPLDSWETPEPPKGAFPVSLEAYTDAVSACNQTPRDNAQAVALGTLAAVVQGQYCVQIGGRPSPENLAMAVGIGADSAERKSADFGLLLGPIHLFESEAAETYREKSADQKAATEVLESRREGLRKRAAKGEEGLIGEMSEVIRQLEALRAIKPRRLMCQDVTPERLSGLLQEQGSMALMSAEGGPFEAMAGKYSGRREVANVFMQGYSGDSITYDRQSGTSYTAERPSLTMVIMSQPSHLQGILSDKLYVGRGLLERFAWFFPRPMAGYRDVGAAAPIPARLANVYKDTLRRLMPPPDPVSGKSPERIPLTIKGDGESAILELQAWLEPQYRPDGELYHVRAWAGRLPTLAAKVGTLWHIWDAASAGRSIPIIVESEWVRRAVAWVREYILPMGLKAWGMMGADAATDPARQVLAALQRSPETSWSVREIRRTKQALTAEQTEAALALLEAKGWIRRQKVTTAKGGRPRDVILLHPEIKSHPLRQNCQNRQNPSRPDQEANPPLFSGWGALATNHADAGDNGVLLSDLLDPDDQAAELEAEEMEARRAARAVGDLL